MKYIIIGFGKFGRLAFTRLRFEFPDSEFIITDLKDDLPRMDDDRLTEVIQSDAVDFLLNNGKLDSEDIIVPMVPFHLASKYAIDSKHSLCFAPLPENILSCLPNPYPIDEFTIACSLADFLCPDDCPEGDVCTVTGETRNESLFERLQQITHAGRSIQVVRSFQLLPGVGGYKVRDLLHVVNEASEGTWAIATSCRCHGIITGVRCSPD